MTDPAHDTEDDPRYPVDLAQDARWPAPKLIVLGLITLLIGIGVIYTAATVLGEHRNNFEQLDHQVHG